MMATGFYTSVAICFCILRVYITRILRVSYASFFTHFHSILLLILYTQKKPQSLGTAAFMHVFDF